MAHADKHLSVAAAAAALHARMNERHLPHLHEIEAIISRIGPGGAQAAAPDRPSRIPQIQALFDAVDDHYAMQTVEGTKRGDALDKELARLCRTIFAEPAATPLDLQERATIARHWLAIHAGDWDKPDDLDDWGYQCIAELIDAVAQFPAMSRLDTREAVAVSYHCPRCHAKPSPAAATHALEAEIEAPMREWYQRLAAFTVATRGAGDREAFALDDELAAYSLSLLKQPAESWLDVVHKVAIAQHWNSPCYAASPDYPEWVFSGREASLGMDDLSLAYVVRGVLAMAGHFYPTTLSSIEGGRALP